MSAPAPVAVVTGASRGIGAALALALAAEGAGVVLSARSAGPLERLAGRIEADGGRARAVAVDLAEPRRAVPILAEAALAAFGRVDALVNNAGLIAPIGPVAELDAAALEQHLAVNLVAPVALAAALLPELRERGGRVVNVSSGAALRPVPGWGAYCASKAGLTRATEVLAAEEPRVVAVACSPGMTATGMQAEIRERGPGRMPPEALARFVEAHETGALRDPGEVGRAIAALALRAPAALSGRFVTVDDEAVRALVESGSRRR